MRHQRKTLSVSHLILSSEIKIMAKGFLATLKPLDAQRLQKSVKATVQASGRLTFAMDAVNDMKLSEDKSIIILAAENGDLGAALSTKGDPEAFALKKCGAYFYVTFKNYLQQAGIDYKKFKVMYDITELDEQYKGKTLYKFERRMILRGEDESGDPTEDATGSEAQEAPKMPQESEQSADASTLGNDNTSAAEGVSGASDEASAGTASEAQSVGSEPTEA